MIVTRAPFRISLFGGGTDFYEYFSMNSSKILSFTINKYIYVILKPREDNFLYINYSLKEIHQNINFIKHDIVRETLKYFKVTKGIEISILSDIPSKGSGLGSSSALCCALILAISHLRKIKLSQKEIAKIATEIEIEILKKPIGVQDQYGCAIGGLKVITMDKKKIIVKKIQNHKLKNIIEKNSILFDTKKNRKSEEILRKQKQSIKVNIEYLNNIKEIAQNFILNNLKELKVEVLTEELNKSWELKKKLEKTITNTSINNKIAFLRKNKFTGFKLCGAGKGGFILAISHNRTPIQLKENFKRIKIEDEGVSLLYFSK